jgi:2-polyprenyl-3-methyl-5-hydroxy-6-metoxy-1,4-benzoquinol methylase
MNNQTLNVDTAELAKFDALASRWWDPEGDFRPLHGNFCRSPPFRRRRDTVLVS